MDLKSFCDSIMRLYLYADMAKGIHYTTEIHWAHEHADDIIDMIRENTDKIAEQVYGYYGRPKFSDFDLKADVYSEEDLGRLLGRCMDVLESMRQEFEKIPKLSGTVSAIDDFKGDITQYIYLANFQKISNYKAEDSL